MVSKSQLTPFNGMASNLKRRDAKLLSLFVLVGVHADGRLKFHNNVGRSELINEYSDKNGIIYL